MYARTAFAGLLAALLVLAGCSSDRQDTATDRADTSDKSPTSAAPTTEAVSGQSPLAGTYATDPITVSHMVDVARQAGFEEKDVAEFRDGYDGVQQVVFTLKLTDDLWVVFETRDGGTATDDWAGPYEVLDGTTVRAGEPPCGPITYDYSLAGDDLTLKLTDDACREGSDQESAPAGELIAQTTIYGSSPFHRIG